MNRDEMRISLTDIANFGFTDTMVQNSNDAQKLCADIKNFGIQIFAAMHDWDRGKMNQSRICIRFVLETVVEIGQNITGENDKQALRELYKILKRIYEKMETKEETKCEQNK